MKKGYAYSGALLIALILCSCSNTPSADHAETSVNKNETAISGTAEVSQETSDIMPFEVVIDKSSLESGKENETTVVISADTEDWDYAASAENGKISNVEANSFVYTVPKDEDKREDTITIQLSDYDSGVSYEYNIPLFFPKVVSES